MGDKNQIVAVTDTDTLAKTGHGIIKAIYETTGGDRTWVIRDGTTAGGTALFTITQGTNNRFEAPYINHPVRDGLFIDNTAAGTGGEILVVFE